MVTNQNAKCSSAIKEPTIPEYTPQSEEKSDYTLFPEGKEPEYTPAEGEDDFDDYMYDDGHDDTYGEDFVVNCGIFFFPTCRVRCCVEGIRNGGRFCVRRRR